MKRGPCSRLLVCRIVRCVDVVSEGSVKRLPWMLVCIAVASVCIHVWGDRLCRGVALANDGM